MSAKIATLETEIKIFAENQPYWAKVLAEKILSNQPITSTEIDEAYGALLQELKIIPETEKRKIEIKVSPGQCSSYEEDIIFSGLENAEGVNALVEKQILQFCPQLTILYGGNGSGKSGYTRLLKNVFYSKSPEKILSNIYQVGMQKPIAAHFKFTNGATEILLQYPTDASHPAFEQFSVFDGKSVSPHLDQKNELEFRPAGLSFFGLFTDAVKQLETKVNGEVNLRNGDNNFPLLFEGDSPVKVLVSTLSAAIKMADLKKFLPFTEDDKTRKQKIEQEHDELLLATRNKDKEIRSLETIKQLLTNAKVSIDKLNKFMTTEALKKVTDSTTDYIAKQEIAKAEGVQGFQTDRLQEVGSDEWKQFIVAAHTFAKKQSEENTYPAIDSNCLLCQQPLSEEASSLISKYWAFIKSEAEKNATAAAQQLQKIKEAFDKLEYNIFPDDAVLTTWLTEKKPEVLTTLRETLEVQRSTAASIISDLDRKIAATYTPTQIAFTEIDGLIKDINETILGLQENTESARLKELLAERTLLTHREKLETHISKIESYVNNQIWIKKAGKANYGKRTITDAEKNLSSKYFNQKYADTFNNECVLLNGKFGIEINHTGAAGTSYKQLMLKGNTPSAILSEGEQKVIAIADFLSEMKLSEINRGIVFDDPVNSLDEKRKQRIAERIVEISKSKQVIVFTHDLVFLSALLTLCEDTKHQFLCHWIEQRDGKPGHVFLNAGPSYEKEYRNSDKPMKFYSEAGKQGCAPDHREHLVKAGFTALRTCYEALVIFELFQGVVQRFNERVSVDSLKNVFFDEVLINELLDSFAQCCRYMEGHTHSDLYSYEKPEVNNLREEIQRYDAIRNKIKKYKKQAVQTAKV